MFAIKKKSHKKSMAEFAKLKTNFVCLGCYFLAVRALYLLVNRKALR